MPPPPAALDEKAAARRDWGPRARTLPKTNTTPSVMILLSRVGRKADLRFRVIINTVITFGRLLSYMEYPRVVFLCFMNYV